MTTKAAIRFPCGCVCTQKFIDGEPCLWTEACEPHATTMRNSLTLDECSYAGCDCPGCEFGRYAHARDPVTQHVPENWRFLTRLAARRWKAVS